MAAISSGAALRVLVADDYPDAAESTAIFLSLAGFETQVAHDGATALASASGWHPHVCILDLGMPKLDGHDVARQIRAQSWTQRPLLIAISGWTVAEHKDAAHRGGFDFYLMKPVEPQELLSIIQHHASSLVTQVNR